jgi:hypothetical protein
LIVKITAAQDAYFATHGKYFQGIKTPAIPLDGVTEGTMDVDVKPTDQLEGWIDFDSNTFKRNTKVPYQMKIKVYNALSGHGWVFTGELFYNSEHLVYRHHNGPETLSGIFDELYVEIDEEVI